MPRPPAWFVYILRCADHSLYTGISNRVPERVAAHNCGRGARYTRTRRPVRLLYTERCGDKVSALRRELEIKAWSRDRKERLLLEGPPRRKTARPAKGPIFRRRKTGRGVKRAPACRAGRGVA